MQLNSLPFDWFDFIPAIMLVIGVVRGRKRGMSEELLDFIQWLVIIFGGAFSYLHLAGLLTSLAGFGDFWSRVVAYGMIAGAIKLLVMLIKRSTGEKIVSTDTFGGMEYYLGMVAGAVRYLCILLLFLTFMNAPEYTAFQLARERKSQEDSLGLTLPTLGSIQKEIFQDSFTGKLVKDQLEFLLIKPAQWSGASSDGIGRQRERMLDQVLDPKNR